MKNCFQIWTSGQLNAILCEIALPVQFLDILYTDICCFVVFQGFCLVLIVLSVFDTFKIIDIIAIHIPIFKHVESAANVNHH